MVILLPRPPINKFIGGPGGITKCSFTQVPGKISEGCPNCPKHRSKGEIQVASVLDKLNINYAQEWRHQTLSHRKYDFYFQYNNRNYIIEYDGRQHFESNEVFDRQHTLKERREVDKIKTYIAYITGYTIIRQDYNLGIADVETHIINGINNNSKIFIIGYQDNQQTRIY